MKTGMKLGIRLAMVVLFVITAVKPASADWLFTPYLGIVFAGAPNSVDIDTLDDNFEQRSAFGGSLAGMGAGIFGVEVDFGYAPNFFQLTEFDGEEFDLFDVNSSVTTLMGNLIVGIPVGGTSGVGVRPYAAAGIGLIRANVSFEDLFEDLSSNDLGINFGGGVHVFFSDSVGIRGDLRYFRGVSNEDDEFLDVDFNLDDFDFWRATVGVTFRFGG
jgi:opacity protein-like surface antigen